MLQVGILLLFLTTIISTILIGTVSSFSYYQELMAIQRDKNEITAVTKQIITKIRYVNNNKIVPFGVNGTDYHELPEWLLFNKNNAFGVPYMYCPYSLDNSLTADDTVLLNDTSTYDVEKINSTITNNHDYVTASDPSPVNNVLAFIVSFKSVSTYTCSDIAFVDHKFQLPDPTFGRVEAITSDSILASDIKTVEMYSIDQTNDTLNADLLKWSALQPERFVVALKEGDIFTVSSDIDFINSEQGVDKEIYINGESNSTLSVISNTNLSNLNFSNVTLILKNINFTGKYSLNLDNVNLYVENSNLKNIKAENSKITFNNVNINGVNLSTTSPIDMYNSELIFKNGSNNIFTMNPSNKNLITARNSNINGNNVTVNFSTRGSINAIESFNSNINLNNSILNLTRQTGNPNSFIYVDSSSKLSLNSMDINQSLSTSFVYTLGSVVIDNSSISMDDGSSNAFILNRGSRLEMNSTNIINDSSVSLEPLIGINDIGASYIGGTSNNIYAKNDCVTGDLFDKRETVTILDDTVTSVNGDLTVNAISSNESVTLDLTDYFNKFTHSCY
jgi:hypothetical protein